jgi:hypothetical protein
VAVEVGFLCPLPLLLCDLVAGVVVVVVSVAMGAADFGMSVAIEAAAKPKESNAAVMRVADLFMRSPNGDVTESAGQITL